MVAAAIRRLAVRGAPAIGVAAYGMALGALEYQGQDRAELSPIYTMCRQYCGYPPHSSKSVWALGRG